jgi:4-amino-4-deoxy-L-arabinose transferase-like glycosyltransferase
MVRRNVVGNAMRSVATSVADRSLALAWVAALGVGAIALGLSVWRVMPGLGFWDTAEFQMVLPVMGTAHPTGYPTYVLIGWFASILLQPLGEAAFRMNVLSAVLVGVGSAFTVDLARRLTGSTLLGIAAGLGTALTPIVWAIGTHADPHALHFALVAIILWLLVRWEQARRDDDRSDDPRPADGPAGSQPGFASGAASAARVARQTAAASIARPVSEPAARHPDRLLLAAAIVVGLSIGNHSLTLLLGPAIILYVLAVEPGIVHRRRFIAANIAAFAIPTVLVRFEMILRAGWFRAPFVYADPSTFTGFWYVTLGAQFHGWLTDPFSNGPERFGALLAMAAGQFGPLAALIAVAFVVTVARQPRYALLSGTTMVLTCFFNSVYPDGAIDRYYIGPALIAWTWLAILAGAAVDLVVPAGPTDPGGPASADRTPRRSMAVNLAVLLRPLGFVVVAALLVGPSLVSLPVRARSAAIDETHDTAAQTWTDEVLAGLEPNAVVVSWWSYSTPLWYATIVDARRPDVCVIDDRDRLDFNLGDLDQVIDRYIATRPVYLVRNGTSELAALEGRYVLASLAEPATANVLHVNATALHGGPVAPPAGSSEPCR